MFRNGSLSPGKGCSQKLRSVAVWKTALRLENLTGKAALNFFPELFMTVEIDLSCDIKKAYGELISKGHVQSKYLIDQLIYSCVNYSDEVCSKGNQIPDSRSLAA